MSITRLVMTSDLPFEQRAEILGNERHTGALLDHITRRARMRVRRAARTK